MTENPSGSSAVEPPTRAMDHLQPATRQHPAQAERTRMFEQVGPANKDHAGFARVPDEQWGYDPAEVDDFLDRVAEVLGTTSPQTPASAPGVSSRQVRERVFDRMQGGYAPAQVDERLDELEDLLANHEREAFIAGHGEERWQEHLEQLGQTLLGRLNRPHGERFRRPAQRKRPGYSVADVDVLCDRVMEHFRSDEALDPGMVRRAVFRQAQGQRCYEEQQVDAFLDCTVELILALR